MTRRIATTISATLTADTLLASIVVSPSSATVTPSGTRPLTAVGYTAGGRVVSITPVWEIDDSTNLSIDSSTGVVTGVNDGHVTAARCRVGAVVSNDCTVTCSAFNAMSAAAAAQLEAIRTGLSSELTMTNHLVPGVTTLTTDPTSTGVGWLVFQGYDDPLVHVADATAKFGYVTRLRNLNGAHVPIASVTRGVAPLITISAGHDTSELSSNWHFTHTGVDPNQGPVYDIKNWLGNGQANSVISPQAASGGIVDSTTVRLGCHVVHSGTTYVCIQTHNSNDATTEPGVGASWTSYWASVPALAVTPPTWTNVGTRYMATDSTSWPVSPPDGQALLGFSAGSGNHSLAAVPYYDGLGSYGDVSYISTISKVNPGYKINDGSGGQKSEEIDWLGGGVFMNHAWGKRAADEVGNDDGPLALHSDRYNVSYSDGTTYSPPQSPPLFDIKDDVTRGMSVHKELIVLHPSARGQNGEEWTFADGVLVGHHFVRVAGLDAPTYTEGAWRGFAPSLATTWGGGGMYAVSPDGYVSNDYEEVYYAVGVARTGAQTDHFHVTCDEGATPSHASPFHVTAELRDANDARMDVFTDSWNPGSGRQKLSVTLSGAGSVGATWSLVATTNNSYFANDGLGRVRIQVTPATTGSITVTASLNQVANNDQLTGVHYDGSVTVTLT